MKMDLITGTLVWYYFICHREVWLMAHRLEPFHDDPFLEIGRIITKESYKKQKKEIRLENMVIDLLDRDGKKIVIGEIKKSSKFITSARMQLAFYLLQMKNLDIHLKGELLIPKEKKRIEVELNEALENELNSALIEIENIIQQEIPPQVKKNPYCRNCAYDEFCWAET